MSIEDDIALLRAVPTLAVLGQEALRVLAIGAESRTVQQGETLFHKGDAADGGYLIEEGTLTATPSGRDQDPITMGRGTLLGELSLLAETRRPATVIAAETSSVMRIPRPLFLRMLQGYPDAAVRLRQILADRVAQITDELGAVRRALDVGEPAAPPPAGAETAPPP